MPGVSHLRSRIISREALLDTHLAPIHYPGNSPAWLQTCTRNIPHPHTCASWAPLFNVPIMLFISGAATWTRHLSICPYILTEQSLSRYSLESQRLSCVSNTNHSRYTWSSNVKLTAILSRFPSRLHVNHVSPHSLRATSYFYFETTEPVQHIDYWCPFSRHSGHKPSSL